MESFSLMFYLEIGLIVLLIAGLFYMHTINKKLKMLKSGGDGFKAVVVELSHATDNAQNAIQGLKLTVRDAEHGLDGNLKQARSVAEELRYLIEQAGGLSQGLQQNPRNIPQPSENLRNIRPPVVPQNRAKNFADQTLEKVANRHRSLPNPIVHSHNHREENVPTEPELQPNLGENIPAEHREIALQRREQALRSIAAKNSVQNRQPPQRRPIQNLRQNTGPNLAPQRNVRPKQNVQPQRSPQPQNAALTHPENRHAVGTITAPSSQEPKMSLSDMVNKHAELERQNFNRDTPSVDVNQPQANASSGAQNASDKRQSLFQKLSKTR